MGKPNMKNLKLEVLETVVPPVFIREIAVDGYF